MGDLRAHLPAPRTECSAVLNQKCHDPHAQPQRQQVPVLSALSRAGCQGSCGFQVSSPWDAGAGEVRALQIVTCLPCRGTCLSWISLRIHAGSGPPHRQAGGGGARGSLQVPQGIQIRRNSGVNTGILVSTPRDPGGRSQGFLAVLPLPAAWCSQSLLCPSVRLSTLPASGSVNCGAATSVHVTHETPGAQRCEATGPEPQARRGGDLFTPARDFPHADLKVAEACLWLGSKSRASPGRAPEWPAASHLGNNQEAMFAQCPYSSPHFVSDHVRVSMVTAVSGGDNGLLFP